jgi:hypothetical protein
MFVETPWLRGEQESAVTNVLEELVNVRVPGLAGSSNRVTLAHDGRNSPTRQPYFFEERID